MEEETSKVTIAVIMNYLLCREVEYSRREPQNFVVRWNGVFLNSEFPPVTKKIVGPTFSNFQASFTSNALFLFFFDKYSTSSQVRQFMMTAMITLFKSLFP